MLGEIGKACCCCTAAYHKAIFVCRLLSLNELCHVKKGFLEELQHADSVSSGIMDLLHKYGFAVEILNDPSTFYEEKNAKFLEVVKYSQRNHVLRFEDVGSDTILYSRTNKAIGIPRYVLGGRLKEVKLVTAFRTGQNSAYFVF